MIEQSTPTPANNLAAVLRFVDGDHTKGAGAIAEAVVALGWKSPAEVARLVRTATVESWYEGAAAAMMFTAQPAQGRVSPINPYSEDTQ